LRDSCHRLEELIKVQDELFEDSEAYEKACLKEKEQIEETVNHILREKEIKKELHVQ
jgi:hypothetical protein